LDQRRIWVPAREMAIGAAQRWWAKGFAHAGQAQDPKLDAAFATGLGYPRSGDVVEHAAVDGWQPTPQLERK